MAPPQLHSLHPPRNHQGELWHSFGRHKLWWNCSSDPKCNQLRQPFAMHELVAKRNQTVLPSIGLDLANLNGTALRHMLLVRKMPSFAPTIWISPGGTFPNQSPSCHFGPALSTRRYPRTSSANMATVPVWHRSEALSKAVWPPLTTYRLCSQPAWTTAHEYNASSQISTCHQPHGPRFVG